MDLCRKHGMSSASSPEQGPCRKRFISTLRMDKRKHILSVDDEGAIRRLLTLALEERGYLVSSATNGASVRDLLPSREHVDAVILGSQMPGKAANLSLFTPKSLDCRS